MDPKQLQWIKDNRMKRLTLDPNYVTLFQINIKLFNHLQILKQK